MHRRPARRRFGVEIAVFLDGLECAADALIAAAVRAGATDNMPRPRRILISDIRARQNTSTPAQNPGRQTVGPSAE